MYLRQVILFDDTPNVVTMMGQPNNVEIGDEGWRTAYQTIDEANVAVFHHILDLILANSRNSGKSCCMVINPC